MRRRYSTNVSVAGVNIQFLTDTEVDICHLNLLFKHHLVGELADEDIQHTVEIQTVRKSIVPEDVTLAWQGYYHGVGHKGKHNNTVRKFVSADRTHEYFLTADNECIANDLRTNRTICALMLQRKWFRTGCIRSNIGTIIILLIHIILTRHCRYSLHASGVVWRDRAIVFTGISGQGKSTICTDLVAQGAGFLGDDIVFVYMQDGRPWIASLLFDAKLFDKSKKTKDFVDILERYGCPRIECAPLQAIAEIKQTRTGPSTIEENEDESQLFDILLKAANNIALQYNYDDWMALCAGLLEKFHLYTFYFGDRKLLDVELLNQFYEQG